MYYYDKSENIFRLNQKYDENGKGIYVEYTDEAYKKLIKNTTKTEKVYMWNTQTKHTKNSLIAMSFIMWDKTR